MNQVLKELVKEVRSLLKIKVIITIKITFITITIIITFIAITIIIIMITRYIQIDMI